MGILGFDHVQVAIPVGGEDEGRRFYADLLGFREVPKPAHLKERSGGCWFEAGSARLHLGTEADFRPAGKAHPALLVSDLEAVTKRLSAAGVELHADDPVDGYDRGFVFDPFGNRVELMQRKDG